MNYFTRIAVIFLLSVLCIGNINAQSGKYWIVFTDKNGSPYSTILPSKFLSAKSIARRAKFGIPVKYNDLPPNPNYIDSVLSKGAKLLNRSGWFNAISIYMADTTKIGLIRALPFVKSGENVQLMKRSSSPINNYLKPLKGTLSTASVDTFNYGYAYNQCHMLKVDCLNNMGYRGKGKTIAVIDVLFGLVYKLPAYDSIRNRGQIKGTWDFERGVAWAYDSTNNDNHGQMVLSCMAGNLPGQMMGDAMDANYYLFRTDDDVAASATDTMIEVDDWASAAEYADSAGADIITSSLGYTTMDNPALTYTRAEMNGRFAIASIAATIASEKGLVVCVAAGNDGGDSWQYIDCPADADSILTVGAVTPSGGYASFSSTGPTYDGRIKPDVAAQGESTVIASPAGGYTYGNGTSFATPLIAGAVASLWQADSNATNFQIMAAIKQSASQYTHPDTLLGYGIPDFCLAQTILGISENKPISVLVKTYPDPFTSAFTVAFYSSVRQNVSVSVYNTLGQVVYKEDTRPVAASGNTLITINGLESLTSGMYIIVIKDEQGATYTGKVMKE